MKKEYVTLGDKPPKIERKQFSSKKTKTIAEQIDMWRKDR